MVDLIIMELKDHMTSFKFECSHWLKLQHSDVGVNLVNDIFFKFSTNESTWIITSHVIYNPAYAYKFQLKTSLIIIDKSQSPAEKSDKIVGIIPPQRLYSLFWKWKCTLIQLNKYETDWYFLQNFQSNSTVCLIIHVFCKNREPEMVFVLICRTISC